MCPRVVDPSISIGFHHDLGDPKRKSTKTLDLIGHGIEVIQNTLNDTSSLTFAVCTNKLKNYLSLIESNAAVLSSGDEYICVVDSDEPPSLGTVARLESCGVRVLQNRASLGLSYSRNRILSLCRTRYLVFLDDDVTISSAVVEGIRESFCDGYGVIGIRLAPPSMANLSRWFLSASQLHYLGIHRPDRPASAWGACMGFNVDLARQNGIWFQRNLGRMGNQLQCGDDTTFLRQLRRLGAQHKVVDTVSATHHVAPDRIKFAYLLRRAMWQGRSEVRRNSPRSGLKKEVYRNFDGAAVSPRRWALAVVYSIAVLVGLLTEQAILLTSGKKRDA